MNGAAALAEGEVEPRTAEILAHTADAFDQNPALKAERLLEMLTSLTKQLQRSAADHVEQVASVSRQFTKLMKEVP